MTKTVAQVVGSDDLCGRGSSRSVCVAIEACDIVRRGLEILRWLRHNLVQANDVGRQRLGSKMVMRGGRSCTECRVQADAEYLEKR